ncbi:MAG: methyltransferase domain-containing protein [Candidatus Binatia bacterium]
MNREAVEQEIAALITPGLRANAWRPDSDVLRQRRMWNEYYHGRRIRILRMVFPRLEEKRILDVGAGRGGLAVALERQGCRVTTLDIRRSSCRVTRLRGQRYGLEVPAVQGRGERLPFPAGAFDVVVCRDVLEHAGRPGELLQEIWRVLDIGGACFMTAINRFCWTDPHYHLVGIAFLPRAVAEGYLRLCGRAKESGRDRQRLADMHYYAYSEFCRWASSFGFAVRDMRAELLHRYRHDGVANRLRWLRYRLLRPLSLQANHFEFLLCKPRSPLNDPAAGFDKLSTSGSLAGGARRKNS